LWVIGVLTALLTATYMFRLVFMTFFGERRYPPSPAASSPGFGGDMGMKT